MVWPFQSWKHALADVPGTSPWEEEGGSFYQSFDVRLETGGSSKGTSEKYKEREGDIGEEEGEDSPAFSEGIARRLLIRTPPNEDQGHLICTSTSKGVNIPILPSTPKWHLLHDLIKRKGSGSDLKKMLMGKAGPCGEHLVVAIAQFPLQCCVFQNRMPFEIIMQGCLQFHLIWWKK